MPVIFALTLNTLDEEASLASSVRSFKKIDAFMSGIEKGEM